MRFIVVGADPHGRSCVSSERALEPGRAGELVNRDLWSTPTLPPIVDTSSRKPENEVVSVLGAPSGSSFLQASLPPGFASPMHQSDTLDYCVVIAGSGTLVLEADEVALEAGDCFVIPGLMHQWRAGERGATVCVTLLGITPAGS